MKMPHCVARCNSSCFFAQEDTPLPPIRVVFCSRGHPPLSPKVARAETASEARRAERAEDEAQRARGEATEARRARGRTRGRERSAAQGASRVVADWAPAAILAGGGRRAGRRRPAKGEGAVWGRGANGRGDEVRRETPARWWRTVRRRQPGRGAAGVRDDSDRRGKRRSPWTAVGCDERGPGGRAAH